MPEDELKIETPGDGLAPDTSADDAAAGQASLEAENAQLRAQVAALTELLAAAPGPTTEDAAQAKETRLIGQDWSSMTAAQAKAAGCTMSVLCSDGYYVPG